MNAAERSRDNREMGWRTNTAPSVFSGHESFACRYGWLPKLYEALIEDPALFSSDEKAILRLGLGRNMVKSLRFWGEAFKLTQTDKRDVYLTEFARNLLDPKDGMDPYLETPDALWRLHWMLTVHGGLGAWAVFFLENQDREITRVQFVADVRSRASETRKTITSGTAVNHVNVFLRTYVEDQNKAESPEDALDSPLQELELMRLANPAGVATVRPLRGPKRSLDSKAFSFVLYDYWKCTAPESLTLSIRSLMLSYAAPGPVLLLDETGLHERLEQLCSRSRRLVLRSDGAGGTDLTCDTDPLRALSEIAWS